MLIFRHPCDLRQLKPHTALYRHLRTRLNRAAETEGYVILIEENNRHITLPELTADLETLSFDGVFLESGFYHAVYLTSNEFALEFLIPDRYINWTGTLFLTCVLPWGRVAV